jgi:Mg-chelatase subunit ChlD
MRNMLFRAAHRFDRDQRGNVAVLFAFSMVPLIGLLGGAVDFARYSRYQTAILNALDATALALVRSEPADDAEADAFVNRYAGALLAGYSAQKALDLEPFDAIAVDGGYRVVVQGGMKTAFLRVLGMDEMPLSLQTEALTSTGDYEIALALDNTGSMAEHDKIGALKDAANHLIDTLYEEDGAEKRVKMALVPFTTTVNIRGAAFDPDWLDPKGLGLGEHRYDAYDREVSRLDIFDALSNGATGADGLPTGWKGCVEARANGHDVDDAAPDGDASTRWTPYLSPDGADRNESGGRNSRGGSYLLQNSYLNDRTSGAMATRMKNVDKYFQPIAGASLDLSDVDEGPNQSCRGPIVELTNDKSRMRDAIDAMQPGGFTHIPQGLAWGWRVLSPGAPFTQGVAYDDPKTQKALVLLSDGKNTVPETYTSYGFLADGRLGSSEATAKRQLDENVTTICEAVKAKGIRLYMILLEENDPATKQIFEDCASVNAAGERLYYEVPTASALDAAFADIGKDLTTLRISR